MCWIEWILEFQNLLICTVVDWHHLYSLGSTWTRSSRRKTFGKLDRFVQRQRTRRHRWNAPALPQTRASRTRRTDFKLEGRTSNLARSPAAGRGASARIRSQVPEDWGVNEGCCTFCWSRTACRRRRRRWGGGPKVGQKFHRRMRCKFLWTFSRDLFKHLFLSDIFTRDLFRHLLLIENFTRDLFKHLFLIDSFTRDLLRHLLLIDSFSRDLFRHVLLIDNFTSDLFKHLFLIDSFSRDLFRHLFLIDSLSRDLFRHLVLIDNLLVTFFGLVSYWQFYM